MKKNITAVGEIPERTIGIDLSDRTFRYCALDRDGKIVEEGQRKLNPESLGKFLAAQPAARVAVETGAHSAWVEALAQQLGHEAIVANARQLARLARVDGELLNPVRLRGAEQQADLFVIRARAQAATGGSDGNF
jgi:transposase